MRGQRRHVFRSGALLAAAFWLLTAGDAAHAQSTTLTFEGLPCTTGGLLPIPNGTAGLNWTNFGCLNAGGAGYANSGYPQSIASPSTVAFNEGGGVAEITAISGVFTLSSAWLTAAWNDGLTVTVEGFRSGVSVGTHTFSPSATARTLVSFPSLVNVDQVRFSSSGGTCHPAYAACPDNTRTHFALDDLSYSLLPAHTITVTPAANGTVLCAPNPVPDGTNATCTATPDAGYAVASFTGCTRVGTTNTCELTNVTAPATVAVAFSAIPAVPTLNPWALMLLGLGAAGLAARRLRKAH